MSLMIDFEYKGVYFKSVEVDKGDSVVTISHNNKEIKSFHWPTYKIFSIPAHADDIINSLEDGLLIAGSTGLGGNVYNPPAGKEEHDE